MFLKTTEESEYKSSVCVLLLQSIAMSQAVKKNINLLRAISLMTPRQRKSVLKTADKDLIQSVCECAYNLLQGNVSVTPQVKRKLSKYKAVLRRLVKKGEKFKSKKRFIIQQGGGFVLPILLSAVLQALLN